MNIEDKVKEILCELSSQEKIENGFSLQDDLMLDSLAMVTLIIDVEDAFDIELDESDMNPFDFDTVQNVIDMVTKYCGDKNEETS